MNCLKMTFRICLTTLFLSTISSALAIQEEYTVANAMKAHDRDTGCQNSIDCPIFPHKATLQCQDHRDCQQHELCHDFFKICFVRQPERSRMKLKKAKTKSPPRCKVDGDCLQNQTCHIFFAICVDKPRMETTAVTKTSVASVRMCEENSDCSEGQYCHDFFNMCLPNLTVRIEPTSSSPAGVGCKSASECKSGEFCHRLTSLCLPMPTTAKMKTTPKSPYSCTSDTECKITEFCHFLTGMRRHQHLVKDKKLQSAQGVCIDKALKEVPQDQTPVSQNCSQSTECGMGRCCLKDLGLCAGYRLLGQLCVAETVPFSCPCLSGLTCVSRRRPMRLKKLEKKLKLPKRAMEERIPQFSRATEFRVGKCQNISD